MYRAGPPLLSRRSRGGSDGVVSPDWRPSSKFTAGTARALVQTDSLMPASAQQQEAADACLDNRKSEARLSGVFSHNRTSIPRGHVHPQGSLESLLDCEHPGCSTTCGSAVDRT